MYLNLKGSWQQKNVLMTRGLILLLLATIFLLPSSPANALGGGGVAFRGRADLPQFPSAGNVGTFSGTATGGAGGVDGVNPWSAAFEAAPLVGTFDYNEPAPCPVQGSAEGTVILSGAATGSYATRTVTDFHATVTFKWTRVANKAFITTTVSADLTFATPPFRLRVITGATDTAVAAFVAHDADDPNPLVDSDGDGKTGVDELCDGGAVFADVFGTDIIAGP